MGSIVIKPKKESKILDLVNQAITYLEPSEDFRLSGENIYKFSDIVYLLLDIIQINNEKNTRIKREIIRGAILQFRNSDGKTINDFKTNLKSEASDYYRKPLKKYTMIFPINIDKDWFTRKRIKLNGYTIHVRTLSQVNEQYFKKNPSLFDQHPEIREAFHYQFTYFILHVYGRDHETAFRAASKICELLRAIINFCAKLRVFSMFPSGSPESDYGPPKIIPIFDEKRQYVTHWNTPIHKRHERVLKPISNRGIILTNITKVLRKYESHNEKNKKILSQLLRLYDYALDEVEYSHMFLSLWQIIENTVRYSSNDKYAVINRRVKNLFRNAEITSQTIDILQKKRHRFVHYGDYDAIKFEDTGRIKRLVDSMLIFLLFNIGDFKSKRHMIYYLDHLNLNENDIDDYVSILSRIKELK